MDAKAVVTGKVAFPVELKKSKNGKPYIQNSIEVERQNNYKNVRHDVEKDLFTFYVFGDMVNWFFTNAKKGDIVTLYASLHNYSYCIKEAVFNDNVIVSVNDRKVTRTGLYAENVVISGENELSYLPVENVQDPKEETFEELCQRFSAKPEDDPNLVFI